MEGQVERLGTRPDTEREDRRADERDIRQHSEDEGEGRQRLDDRDDHHHDGGIGHAVMFVSASHWWMTGVLTCDTLPSSSCRVCPWMNPGCHLKLASQAHSTPNRMRTTAAPRSQRRPKTAERVVLRDEAAADGASRVVDTGVHLF